ncbi:MAG TPA: acyltransferase [Clostridiales bacterium]|nr:acyltransferase [Clostridiales bacterium]
MNISEALKNKRNNFDLIRLIAAVMVIYSHSYALCGKTDPGPSFYQQTYGGLGVAIFLMISGFLVTLSWFKSENLSVFLKARCLRIFPALIFVIFITTFILGPIVTSLPLPQYFSNPDTYRYLKTITLFDVRYYLPGVFTDNVYQYAVNGSLWSLVYEFIFYLIVAFFGVTGLLKRKSVTIFLFAITLTLSSLNAFPTFHIYTIYFSQFLPLFTYFTAGMLFYIFKDHIPLSKSFAAISILVLILASFFSGLNISLFIIFGTYLIFFIALSPDIKLPQISKVGDFSYGLYIYAFPVQQFVVWIYGNKISPINNFMLSTIIALFFSAFSWHIIEKNFLKLKNHAIMPTLMKINPFKVND